MEYTDELVRLCVNFDHFRNDRRSQAVSSALPVLRTMNDQLFDATVRANHVQPVYKAIAITDEVTWTILQVEDQSDSPLASAVALGWNKRFEDETDYRTLLGDLVRRGKQYGENDREPDVLAVRALAALTIMAAQSAHSHARFDLVVPVPSTKESTNTLPASMARMVGECIQCHYTAPDDIGYTRSIGKLKYLGSREARNQEIRNALHAKRTTFSGKGVLLIDDLWDTGTTLRETARAVLAAGALEVHAIALAQTRKFAGQMMSY